MAQPIHFLVFGFKDTLQNTGHKAEEISFVVCDVNSEKEQLQVIFLLLEQIFSFESLKQTELALCQKTKTDKNE